jgi:tryptophanyl-tRNA synthetase
MTLYTIDDLHFSVNDIHEQWDDGKIHYEDAKEILVRCCKEFIKQAEQKQNEN